VYEVYCSSRNRVSHSISSCPGAGKWGEQLYYISNLLVVRTPPERACNPCGQIKYPRTSRTGVDVVEARRTASEMQKQSATEGDTLNLKGVHPCAASQPEGLAADMLLCSGLPSCVFRPMMRHPEGLLHRSAHRQQSRATAVSGCKYLL
jgi:hypothetical protein